MSEASREVGRGRKNVETVVGRMELPLAWSVDARFYDSVFRWEPFYFFWHENPLAYGGIVPTVRGPSRSQRI